MIVERDLMVEEAQLIVEQDGQSMDHKKQRKVWIRYKGFLRGLAVRSTLYKKNTKYLSDPS